MLDPIVKKNAMTRVKLLNLLSVTTGTTNALDVKLVLTHNAGSLLTTARSFKREVNVNHKRFKDSIE